MGQDSEYQGGRAVRIEAPTPPIDPADLVVGLERVRECVHRWIDRIEERLDDAASPTASGEDLERAARDLEEQREALRAEAGRRDREWAERLEALEHDRRLLADAWERLEREQLAHVPAARPAQPPTMASPPAAHRATPAGDEPDNSVDRAILHQFEALRRDVRRTAEAQRHR